MQENAIIDRVRRGWRAIVVGAVLGAVVFTAYSFLSRSAGVFSQTMTYQLSDPRAAMAELGLDVEMGVEDTAMGVADMLQATAVDSFALGDVRVVARGVDGSRLVAVTITGSEGDVTEAAQTLLTVFPQDRAEQIAESADRAIVSIDAEREILVEEVAELDAQLDALPAEGSDVVRERLLLDRVETTRQILDAERQVGDLERLQQQDPAVSTRLVSTTSGESVGTSPFTAVPLGLVFGALVGLVVVLTRSDRSPEAPADRSVPVA